VCQSLLADLRRRGLRTDRSHLVALDGSKTLHQAVTQALGSAALIRRCQVHKLTTSWSISRNDCGPGSGPWSFGHKQVAVVPAPVPLQDLRADSRPVSDYRGSVREGLDARLH